MDKVIIYNKGRMADPIRTCYNSAGPGFPEGKPGFK
jgi:hypothetical protein